MCKSGFEEIAMHMACSEALKSDYGVLVGGRSFNVQLLLDQGTSADNIRAATIA